jgi:hypothetical protein
LNKRLGILLGARIFVPFMKYDYEECMSRLRKEVNSIFSIEDDVVGTSDKIQTKFKDKTCDLSQIIDRANSAQCKRWTVSETEKWFEEKKINKDIVDHLKSCDGEILCELFGIIVQTPDVFYRTLSLYNNSFERIPLSEIAKFGCELKKLFTN